MAPSRKIELFYLHFTFVGKDEKNEEKFEIMISQDTPDPCNFVTTRRDWMEQFFLNNLSNIRASRYKFLEWRFLLSDPKIFKVCDIRFDKVLIVLARDIVYYSFYMNTKKNQYLVEGEVEISWRLCPWCIEEKYLGIANGVRNLIKNNNIIATIDVPWPATSLLRLILDSEPWNEDDDFVDR